MPFFRPLTPAGPAPLTDVDALFLDLDGVVYRGPKAVDHAVEELTEIAEAGMTVAYITNNASRTDATVAAHLRDLGLNVRPDDVVTSPQAAVHLLSSRIPEGALVLVIGGDGLVDELGKAGYRITRSADDLPDAVVQGFAPDVGWADLAEASFALVRDIPWVATNQDWTIPVERGIAPGNGTLVSAVHTAVQKLPLVAGKPETALFDAAKARFGVSAPLMVGDRLDTDIRGGRRAGIRTAFVRTGVDRAKQLLAAEPDDRPDFILDDLRGLRLAYPSAEVSAPRPDTTVAKVGGAEVILEGPDLRIRRRGAAEVDLLRAACTAIWESGKRVYALRIPEELLLL